MRAGPVAPVESDFQRFLRLSQRAIRVLRADNKRMRKNCRKRQKRARRRSGG